MNFQVCDSPESLAQHASLWIGEHIGKLHARSIFVPAGNTPLDLYALWEREKPNYLKNLELLQIDDVATGSKKGLFATFFRENLPSYVHQLVPVGEASREAAISVLGLGLNGHVAFHEPGLPNDFYSGCVKLTAKTCETLELEANTWGITYGAGAFARSKAVLMIVKGASKKEVLKKLRAGDPALPASALAKHPNFLVLADRESGG